MALVGVVVATLVRAGLVVIGALGPLTIYTVWDTGETFVTLSWSVTFVADHM